MPFCPPPLPLSALSTLSLVTIASACLKWIPCHQIVNIHPSHPPSSVPHLRRYSRYGLKTSAVASQSKASKSTRWVSASCIRDQDSLRTYEDILLALLGISRAHARFYLKAHLPVIELLTSPHPPALSSETAFRRRTTA